jgi:tetratricopeptide (TPR) repeat protein
MVCQTLLFYPFKTLLPLGYSVAYPFVKEQGSWGITYLAAPLVLAVLAYLVYKYLRNSPNYLLGLGLYLLPLVVMLPFRTVGSFELRSDRYAYLSSIGLLFVVFLFLEKLDTKLRNGILIAAAVVLGFLAIQQAQVWNNGVDLFKNCVDKTPESSLCQCNLAYNSLLTKQYEAAVDHYTAALKYDPSTIEAYNGRGQAYMELRKFPEAYSDFDQAIKGGLSSPKLFLNRGKCLVINGQPEKAIPDLSKSLELEPKSPEAYYFRATAYDKTNQPDQALKDYGQALAQNPNYVEAMVNRGQLQFKSQQYAAAIEDFTNGLAIAADAVKPMILVNRANAYLMSGNTQSALEDANQALAINPNFQRGYHSRAAIWKTLGNAAKAAEDLKKAGN